MEDWKTYSLGDVCNDIFSGGTPSSMNPEYWGGELLWLSSGETSQRFIYDTKKRITPIAVENSSTRLAKKDSTVVATAGQGRTRGQVSYLKVDTYINQSVIALEANPALLDPLFLYYNLDGRYEEFRLLSDGTSTRGSLSGRILKSINIRIPRLDVQKKIVSILKSLDDKIELNNRIIRNLEEQAQAIFKRWFVNFEQFQDGDFMDSELGRIPCKWRVGSLDEICEIVGGGTPSKSCIDYYCKEGIAWLTPKDLSNTNAKFTARGENDITELGYKNSGAKLIPRGSILFSSRAPIGYISIAKNNVCTNQGFKSAVPQMAGTAFLYFFLKLNTKTIIAKATGSTFKEASGALMKSLHTIIPPVEILQSFEELEKPFFQMQESLEAESKYLSILRDSLLPKLMSGEISV
ncbi:MAG: restriction endonuclease subunit S [Bacteroidales bacterium]|nr:restriction endonuclease subunit S [Bacteroidales bacterium]